MTKAEKLNELYVKYDLTAEDYFKSPQGWTIITRSGVDAIQAKAGIKVTYDVLTMERDWVVVKGTGTTKSQYVESFGEATKGGFPNGNTKTSYVVAMAEKRAMSRVVLKLAGFYELGAFGEDESEDFKPAEKKHIPANQYAKAQSAILKGEKTYEETIEIIEEVYTIGESQKHALKQIKAQ